MEGPKCCPTSNRKPAVQSVTRRHIDFLHFVFSYFHSPSSSPLPFLCFSLICLFSYLNIYLLFRHLHLLLLILFLLPLLSFLIFPFIIFLCLFSSLLISTFTISTSLFSCFLFSLLCPSLCPHFVFHLCSDSCSCAARIRENSRNYLNYKQSHCRHICSCM